MNVDPENTNNSDLSLITAEIESKKNCKNNTYSTILILTEIVRI